MPFLFLLFLLFVGGASPLAGQIVRVDGAERDSASILLDEIVDRGNYIVVDRDTTLAADVALPGDLLVVDARVALEGSVAGTVAVIRGDFFARPGSRVGGRILVIGGGAYPSALAETGEIVYLDPRATSDLELQATGYGLILRNQLPGILRIPGMLGFRVPTYDRVDGLSIHWGGGLGFGGDTATIAILGSAAYRTERERLHGGVELRIRAAQRARISLSLSRSTHTNEEWIRGELPNSLSSLLVRSDVRNYYESDEARVGLIGLPAPPLVEGEGFVSPTLIFRLSEDRSVDEGSPWSLFSFDGGWRNNPAIDDGVLGSAVAGTIFGWRGATSTFSGTSAVEWSPGGIGDFDFAQLRASADWWMIGPYTHEIQVGGYLLMPLGSGYVPRQRWSILGGPGTLPTFDTGTFRGDRVLYVHSSYVAELPQVALPIVGPPALRFEYAAGAAWSTGFPRPPLEQNVGAGIQFLTFMGMVYADPAQRPLKPVFTFGAQFPFGGGSPVF